jgi:hypothetical protein
MMKGYNMNTAGCLSKIRSYVMSLGNNHKKDRNIINFILVAILSINGITYSASKAQFIKCEIPDSAYTDTCFIAKIYMKNTGSDTWSQSQTGVTLCSQNPKYNQSWGTYFIIQGQGTSVKPGDTFVFTSRLRAPSDTGKISFSWQCLNTISDGGYLDTVNKTWFGDIVNKSIYVKQGAKASPLVFTRKNSIIDSANFIYIGSMKIPVLSEYNITYSESGLALKSSKGAKHLLVCTYGRIFEISIPTLNKITDSSYSNINTGTLIRNWGIISKDTINSEPITPNSGFWYDDSSSLLYWTHYNGYYTTGVTGFPQISTTKLDTNGIVTKHWYLPATLPMYKGFWAGVTKIPDDFANKYTNGRNIGLGFGGYFSICQTASRGPSLGAMAKPDITSSTLSVTPIMYYTESQPSIRTGNYLPVVGFWDDLPENIYKGYWAYDDYCRAGVFINLPDNKGYMAFVQQCTGRIGYDYGGYNTDAHTQDCWYFYKLSDLGAAVSSGNDTTVSPSSFAIVNYPFKNNILHGLVSGACFDSSTRILYVYLMYAQSNYEPIIHAYYVDTTTVPHVLSSKGKNYRGKLSIRQLPDRKNVWISLTGNTASHSSVKLDIYTINGRAVLSKIISIKQLEKGFLWNTVMHSKGTYLIELTENNILESGLVFVR